MQSKFLIVTIMKVLLISTCNIILHHSGIKKAIARQMTRTVFLFKIAATSICNCRKKYEHYLATKLLLMSTQKHYILTKQN